MINTGFGVCTGAEALSETKLDGVGSDVGDEDDGLELGVVGAGGREALTTVVVTSCVTVGPGFTISIVFVGLMTGGGAASVDPPSTLMTE